MAVISLEKIEAIASDQASLVAARKLVKPSSWSGLSSDNAGLIWGECQGSGSSPYRVVASEIDAGYKCTCPSRKFPCKHSLALMWMRAERKVSFESAESPQWVQDWVRRRRSGSDVSASAEAQPKSLVQATTDGPEEIDPKVEARAAAARDRSRRERETAILAGLDDLDRWLIDQTEGGLAGFAGHAGKSCRSIAQRLVDAKAPGLASRLDLLPSRILSLPEHLRATVAVEQLGQLHLLAEAYRRQESLDLDLCADVRREVGWTQARESLLGEDGALCISGSWRVVGIVSEVQPDRLRRLETWLWREGATDAPHVAVLLDFVPIASGQTRGPYRTGERMEATLVYYRFARPLRALIKETSNPAHECSASLELSKDGLAGAIAEYENALTRVPWINMWPMKFSEARVRRNSERLFLCSANDAGVALPLLMSQASTVTPLLAMEKIDGFGLWDGYSFRLCFAQTLLGRWVSE